MNIYCLGHFILSRSCSPVVKSLECKMEVTGLNLLSLSFFFLLFNQPIILLRLLSLLIQHRSELEYLKSDETHEFGSTCPEKKTCLLKKHVFLISKGIADAISTSNIKTQVSFKKRTLPTQIPLFVFISQVFSSLD